MYKHYYLIEQNSINTVVYNVSHARTVTLDSGSMDRV